MSITSPSMLIKRKAVESELLLETKRPFNMYAMKQEFNNLLSKKKGFLFRQQQSSLLIDPLRTDDNPLIKDFSSFYRRLSYAPVAPEEHSAQLALIEQVIQEVCAISDDDEHALFPQPKLAEAFFRATLVKLSSDGGEPKQVAGRMILTQREGTAASKNSDQIGATVSDGKLVASQAASDTHTYVLLKRMSEHSAKTTSFIYHQHVLCATFPEMGVALNSMVDRRQLATRYAVQVEVALNIDNKLIVNHTVFSHPFLIAITNDQTEPLLFSIFWNRMLCTHNREIFEVGCAFSKVPWVVLSQAIRYFVKSQIVSARSLQYHEICHLQCMILLPRVLRCKNNEEFKAMELELYGNSSGSSLSDWRNTLRNRLLTEQVLPVTLIEKREFMMEKCISCLDMCTQLQHTVWSWLFRATELLQDVGHKLCPSPTMGDKKCSKTKKQMAMCEQHHQTMLSLFNNGLITFASPFHVRRAFQDPAAQVEDGAMLIRLCDENSGFLSFCFGFEKGSRDVLRMGSLSAEQVKEFKQGLPEVLMDEQYPSKFAHLVEIGSNDPETNSVTIFLTRKRSVFHNYQTMRKENAVHVQDNETIRVNPLTGRKVVRSFASIGDPVQTLCHSEPMATLTSLPLATNALFSMIQQQMALPMSSFLPAVTALNFRELIRTMRFPETAEDSEPDGEEEVVEVMQSPSSKLIDHLSEEKSNLESQ